MITLICFFDSRGRSREMRVAIQTLHVHEAKIAARAAVTALFDDASFTQLLLVS